VNVKKPGCPWLAGIQTDAGSRAMADEFIYGVGLPAEAVDTTCTPMERRLS
jgi:hypothetical protein